MKTDFKVYKRTIDVYVKDTNSKIQKYLWSTNAHKTCKSAVLAAKHVYPKLDFVAYFKKD
jgi:hypothetical protein